MKVETNTKGESTLVYWNVLADGKFHQTVEEGTEGAVIRHYEDKETKEDKIKHELVAGSLSGIITKVELDDTGAYGEVIRVELDGEGMACFPCSGNFGEDIMKKLPNINKDKEVKFTPYSFADKIKKDSNGKPKLIKGVTVEQDGIKLLSAYWDGEKIIGGIPVPKGDTTKFSKDKWKMYFTEVRIFLIDQLEEKGLATRYVKEEKVEKVEVVDDLADIF